MIWLTFMRSSWYNSKGLFHTRLLQGNVNHIELIIQTMSFLHWKQMEVSSETKFQFKHYYKRKQIL